MRCADWKKRTLLLVTISLTALFVTSIVPKTCQSIPFRAHAEHRSSIPIYLVSEPGPAAGNALFAIGDRVINILHSGDTRSLAAIVQGSLKDNLGIDLMESVPEPSTLLIVGSGLIGFALFARKRFRK